MVGRHAIGWIASGLGGTHRHIDCTALEFEVWLVFGTAIWPSQRRCSHAPIGSSPPDGIT